MPSTAPKKSLFQRQIPTILGLVVLVVALVAGLLFFGQGTGVFAPRATPQTTPKNIKVTNINDTSFTVSFVTDEKTAGFVKYGSEANSLRSQASDDRDQLSGSVGSYVTHHITVRGLEAGKEYFYTLGTGSQAEFDNNGEAFSVTTAARGGTPSAAKTIYGNVLSESGGPAEGSIVFVSIEGVGQMSSLVKASGTWAIPLSNARTLDGSSYATIDDTTTLNITVQGPAAASLTSVTATVAEAQPVGAITLGQGIVAAEPTSSEEPVESPEPEPEVADATIDNTDAVSATNSAEMPAAGGLSNLVDSTASGSANASSSASTTTASTDVVNLELTSTQTVTTSTPTIKGKAAPNATITIEVHSETQINQQITADASGNFELDIAALSQQLEPGEHTVTYSYVDPTTQQTVTKTKTFRVSGTSTQLAQATGGTTTSGPPYGSGNPVPIGGATTSASASPSATATASSTVTATRSSTIATTSSLPKSGSVGLTYALLFGGIFFMIAGCWSFWVSKEIRDVNHQR